MKKHENPSFLIKMAQKKQKDSSRSATALKEQSRRAIGSATQRARYTAMHPSASERSERPAHPALSKVRNIKYNLS
ncbi:hypothetical protein [Geobacillus subterraneus]|uniref:hypothetical protein n=1 Tax=Geobacillus subterraneus TaxID=129338 RepID=UPI0016159A2C